MKDSMMLISTPWQGVKSFKLIPINEECPYVECIYDPQQKVMAVIGKISKETFHMLPKLDSNGNMVPSKVAQEGTNPYKQERVMLDTFQEYYLSEMNEQIDLINMFAVNAGTFDYKSIMNSTVSEPETLNQ
jgi:hypothetical protein